MSFTIPLWAFYAFAASLTVTAIPLLQEKMRINGFALAFLIKVATAIIMLPFVLRYGLPQNPEFYAYLFATAILYSISDVIYFRSVPEIGAGVMTRLLPATVVITFIAWFFIDPALLQKYLSKPVESAAISGCILLSIYFAMRLKKCSASWHGAKKISFVLFAASVGPIFQKLTLGQAAAGQAVYGYVFIQAIMMIFCWSLYAYFKKPINIHSLIVPKTALTGIVIGAFSACAVVLKSFAYIHAEHPAYIPIILFTDTIWVILIHRLIGRQDNSDVTAGLGIVACAAALVFLKSLY